MLIPEAPSTKAPRAARYAVGMFFFGNGFILATWASRIPAIKEQLDLTQAQLGIALLGSAIGALVAMNIAGYLASRFGSRPVTIFSGLWLCAALPILALAPSLPLLFSALFMLGAANGSIDVSMNSQGVAVEHRYGRPILTSFHGLYSVGGLIGALLGGLIAGLGIVPLHQFLGVALVLAAGLVVAAGSLLPAGADATGSAASFARPSRAVLAIGLVAFCVALGEGALADWSAVYLNGTIKTGAGVAALGYAAFSLMMATFRLTGDRLTLRHGRVLLVRTGLLISAFGLSVAILIPVAPVAIFGFGLVGAGSSVVFPIAMSAAGNVGGMSPGTAIAAAATCGYFGFLVGPVAIGFVAQLLSLRLALCIVVVLNLIGAMLASAVRHRNDVPSSNELVLGHEEAIPL